MKKFIAVGTAILLFTLMIAGCNKEGDQPRAAADALPAGLVSSSPPGGAVDVIALRKTAKDGDTVVVKGRVGGQKEPLASNRAIMTVADLSLPTCDKTPMDTCPTPWDSCCEPTTEIAAKSISIQVVGADRRPLKSGLGGATGIAPLKQVIVSGTVRMAPGS